MKPLLLLTLGAALASAQSATTTFMKDINGNRVEGQSFTSTDGERTERFQSINGRQVPLEQQVDRVVREDANGKVTERIVRKFNPNGQLASTERVLIEENKLPGGGSSVRATTYRNDVNGSFHEAERQTTETRVAGSTSTANTVIDRPTLNGSFETIEKRSEITEGSAANQRSTESVYRRDGTGGFQEALRYVKTASKVNDTTTESTANYEPGVNGQLRLASQSESAITKQPDGTELIQTNLYSQTVVGRLQDNDAPMRIKEQQIVERRTKPDGSVVETFSVRRPSISDPNRLGELQKLSETVCRGKCQPEKPTPADTSKDTTKSATGNSRP
ncbi:MAG: hypothetical protein JWO19_367 [Bryobacterales bacterium]|nr:hypothetical protein [Bryobacterales bacterium]